ncbi:MAG: c-type cytochrome [Gammaproteobacteria bacterium]
MLKKAVLFFAWACSFGLIAATKAETVQAKGDVEAGKAKSAVCAACHGQDGNSLAPQWPKLAGQHVAYLEKQLTDFKADKREDPAMGPVAASLSEDEILDLAAYYALQEIAIGKVAKGHVSLGRAVYHGGVQTSGVPACMACHGPSGKGNPAAGFPALRGQHAKYTEKQLQAYASGQRSNDGEGAVMRDIAARLSSKEIQAVAAYIQGLHEAIAEKK